MLMSLEYRNDQNNTGQKVAAIITGLIGIACVFLGVYEATHFVHRNEVAIALLGWGWASVIIAIAWYWWCRRTEEK